MPYENKAAEVGNFQWNIYTLSAIFCLKKQYSHEAVKGAKFKVQSLRNNNQYHTNEMKASWFGDELVREKNH